MSSSPPLIRFAHPMAFQSFLRGIGAPADRYMRQNGLPTLCDDPDFFVPVKRVWSFFDQESKSEDPLLGWHVGKHVGDHALNAHLLRKIERAPTLLEALRTLCALVRAEGTDIDIGIFERREDIMFYTHYWDCKETPGYHVSQAYQLSVFLDLIRFFAGRDWMPSEIGLEAVQIPPGLQELLPGSRILLNQPFGYVAISRAYICRTACHTFAQNDEQHGLRSTEATDYIENIRSVLSAYLSEGYVSEGTAAGLLDTSVRSLTRTLAARGLTYGKLVDEVRFETAKKYLAIPGIRIIDVANSVGFRDQANFTRMFRRISGNTPGQFRKLIRRDKKTIMLSDHSVQSR